MIDLANRLLATQCINFHDSEIHSLNLSQAEGRWDRHLISVKMPAPYDYAIGNYSEAEKALLFRYLWEL